MARGVPIELPADNPITFRVFDKCMACVENIGRGEPAGFKLQCDDDFLLTVGVTLLLALFPYSAWQSAESDCQRAGWVAAVDWNCLPLPCLPLPAAATLPAAVAGPHAAGGAGSRRRGAAPLGEAQPAGSARWVGVSCYCPRCVFSDLTAIAASEGNAELQYSMCMANQQTPLKLGLLSAYAYAPMLPTLQTYTAT